MTDGDLPEVDLSDLIPEPDPVSLLPLVTRRLTWDCLPCSDVDGLLPALGLPPSSEEGWEIDHVDSHQRVARVEPLEPYLQSYSSVLGVILTTAMLEANSVKLSDDGSLQFSAQNTEVILSGTRAILAQLFDAGLITYGPEVQIVAVAGE